MPNLSRIDVLQRYFTTNYSKIHLKFTNNLLIILEYMNSLRECKISCVNLVP